MNTLPTSARVVIIGGGIVGTSTLYHLAKKGWSDCVLLEKNELTAGSTWHAAGNCPSFSMSWPVMNMQRYSLELYRTLAKEVDYPMNYHVTGSIRLAHTDERMAEFAHAKTMADNQGLKLEMMSLEQMKKAYPFIETHDLAGGLYDPDDGDIDPAQLTQALAKGARKLGAHIQRFCPATGVTQHANKTWTVHTENGDIGCDYVVNAAGYYAQRIGEWFKPYGGRTVPMTTMSHQYFLTDEIPELQEWTALHGRKIPLLRDVDSSYYLRQDKNGLNLGPYERNCKAHWATKDDPMPEDFSFQLYPDDLDRLEWYIEDAMARVPILGTAGVSRVINGPIPYAPDGLPLLGPMPGVQNAFEACAFTFGITQGGGAGKVMAEWIMDGAPKWDMWAVDPRRYTGFADQDYCLGKALETYGHEYAMHFPYHEWPAARDKKRSPLHDTHLAARGVMGAYNGWERVNWYAQDGDDTSETATLTWARSGPWQKRIEEECLAVRDHAGILDLTGFARFHLKGEGSADFLQVICTGRLSKVGRVALIYLTDEHGRIVTEMTAMRVADDEFHLTTAASAQWHDFEWLTRHRPDGATFTLTDMTADSSCVLLTGPKARDILAPCCDADLSLGWLTHQNAVIAEKTVQLMRVSYAGELGWEVHSAYNDMPEIYAKITAQGQAHGLKAFGMYALNSLRIEKGYRIWKGDLSTDYTALEGGLERFINLDKNFIGKDALAAEAARGVLKRFTILTLDESCPYDAPAMSTLWYDGKHVGEVTSSAWGYRVGASISLAMIQTDLAQLGTQIEVEIFGQRIKATVRGDAPLWDPENARLRS